MKTRLLQRVNIPKEGSHQVSDKTDPDWADKRINQIAREYKECPAEWKEQFLAGLEKGDVQKLIDRGFIEPRSLKSFYVCYAYAKITPPKHHA